MKKLFMSLMILALISVSFVSCDDDIDVKEPKMVDVSFNLENLNLTNKLDNTKSLAQKQSFQNSKGETVAYPECTEDTPASVEVTIGTETYAIEFTSLTGASGLPNETEVIQLVEGDYTINEFIVLNAQGDPIYSAPMDTDPEAASLISLPLDITLGAFTKSKINLDVVCWHEFSYQPLAWGWFKIDYYQKKSLTFFGDVCSKFFTDFGANGYDFVAAITVKIYNNGVEVASVTNADSSNPFMGVAGEPLIIEYLDNLQLNSEVMTFDITLHTPTGDIPLEVGTSFPDGVWSADDGSGGFGGTDGVWNFNVGNCGNAANEANYPAYLNIPNEVAFTLLGDNGDIYGRYTATAYAGTIASPTVAKQGELPTAFNAWCVDPGTVIHLNVTYDAKVYSLLRPVPNSTRMTRIANVKGKLHWIINHIDEIAAAKPSWGKNEFQNLIWHVVDNATHTGYATYATGIVDYDPKVGDYALVVIDPVNVTGASVQAFGVRVDP